MPGTNDLLAVAALGATAVTLLLLRALPPELFGRGAIAVVGLSMLVAASPGALPAESGWIPAGIFVLASALLFRGAAARAFALATLPAFTLSARAAHELTSAAWGPSRAAWTLMLTSVPVLALVGAWPRVRERLAAQHDMLLLLALVGLAILAGPEAATAWRRASIAAEGQDPQAALDTPLWPITLGAAAFVLSFVWRSLRRDALLSKGTPR